MKTTKITSALIAAVTCISMGSFAAYAEDDTAVNMIPQSFNEALEFYNNYGKTHTEGNSVCYVRKVYENDPYAVPDSCPTDKPVSVLFFDKDSDVKNYVSKNTYTYEADENDPYAPEKLPYEFEVYAFELNSGETLSFTDASIKCTKDIFRNFKFIADNDGTVSEDDIYAKIPDCYSEYMGFKEKNGNVSLIDNDYVIFCGDVNCCMGAGISFSQYGAGKLSEIANYDVTESLIYELCGGYESVVKIYEPTEKGELMGIWTHERFWDLPYDKYDEYIKCFNIGDDLSVSASEKEIDELPMVGDVNGDEMVDSADASMILGDYARTSTGAASELTLQQLYAADIDESKTVDSADASFILRQYAYNSTHN